MPRSQRQSSRAALAAVPIETPEGVFVAHFSEYGLAQLDFPSSVPPASCRVSSEVPPQIPEWTKLTQEAVVAILSGEENVAALPLDLTAGTSFQQKVWSELQQIHVGKTKTYSEIAVALGSPKATRAVGNACGANPIPLLIPCHRVLASKGKLGGFSGGLPWKMKLLVEEGALPETAAQKSFSFGTAV